MTHPLQHCVKCDPAPCDRCGKLIKSGEYAFIQCYKDGTRETWCKECDKK